MPNMHAHFRGEKSDGTWWKCCL